MTNHDGQLFTKAEVDNFLDRTIGELETAYAAAIVAVNMTTEQRIAFRASLEKSKIALMRRASSAESTVADDTGGDA